MPDFGDHGGSHLRNGDFHRLLFFPAAVLSATCGDMTACLLPSLADTMEAVSILPLAGRSLMPRVRRRVRFSGRVQGVGFRFTCQSLARGFEIAGQVRNLIDGQVELVAEGESVELDRYLAAIRQEMDTYIKDVQVETESPGPAPLVGFSIRH